MITTPSRVRAHLSTLSLRKRVGLLAGFGVGIIVVVVALASYITVRASLLHQLDTTLIERARAASSGPLANPRTLSEVPAEAVGAGDVRLALLSGNRSAISTEGEESAPPLGAPELAVAQGRVSMSVRTVPTRSGDVYRVVAVPTESGPALVMGQSLHNYNQILGRMGFVLLIVGGAGVALAAWAGFGIARTGLRPVERLTQAAEHVARTGDLRPVPVQGEDELARLAHAFNAMLAAVSTVRAREKRLIADAGHELRTPLTSLRTNLDLLVQSETRPGLSPEDRRSLLDDLRGQVTELSALVGDLVELSRDDPASAARVPLDLAELTTHAVERVRRRAPNLTFDVGLAPWPVVGDPQALERAVTNLLDNAAKWSPPHSVVTVRLVRGVLTVEDHGPGIADADLPHVFERFYRSAEARTMPGSGLGLAIVKQAIDRHGGTVHAARASGGGALFVVRLPQAPSPRAAQG